MQRIRILSNRLRLVSYFLFFTHCDVICDPLQYTHTRKKCNLFVLYNKNSNGLLGYEKKKNKSADVDLTPSVCAL